MDPMDGPKWNWVRRSMGQTLIVSKRINLANMLPRKDLASSGYCLANPGAEYLVYLPSDFHPGASPLGERVTPPPYSVEVDLSEASGTFNVEWFDPTTDEFTHAGKIDGGAKQSLNAPFVGPAVLHLAATKVGS
jgi:hypothetical protein